MAVVIDLFAVNEVELIYRKRVSSPGIVVAREETAIQILRSAWDSNKIELIEQFKVLLLDTGNSCLGVADIASGGLDSCPVDPRLVFATALKAKATQIIVAHNHPSGNLKPSDSDINLTKKLCAAGAILGIPVLDHFILTKDSHKSFAAANLIP